MGVVGFLSTVVAGASAASDIAAKDTAREEQADYNAKLKSDAIEQYGALDEIEADILYDSHASSLEAQKQFMTARNDIELQSAVTGVYGNSIDASIKELGAGLSNRVGEIISVRDSELKNVALQADNIKATAEGRADRSISQPDWYTGANAFVNTFSSTYNTGSSFADSFDKGSRATSGRTKPKPISRRTTQ